MEQRAQHERPADPQPPGSAARTPGGVSAGTTQARRPPGTGFVLGLTVVVLVVPYLGQLLTQRDARFGFAAPDTFYYLTVARNVIEHGMVSFDQATATNAFHPVWQLVCIALMGIGRLLSLPGDGVLVLSLVVGLLFVGAGLVGLARAMTADGSRLSPLFVGLPLGLYAVLLVGPIGSAIRWGTLWGYANGMESGVLLGLYGVLAWAWGRLDETGVRRQAPLFGALCALFALARLDHAILPAWLLIASLLGAVGRGDGRRSRFWLVAAATWAGLLIVYVSINLLYAGTALPASGSLKSSFPFPVRDSFVHTVNWLRDADSIGTTLRLRLGQLVVPFVVTLTWGIWMLWRHRRHTALHATQPDRPPTRRRDRTARAAGRGSPPGRSTPAHGMAVFGRYEQFLIFTAWSVLGLFLYDFLFVKPFDQGFWYTPVSVLFVSLVVLHAVGRMPWHDRLTRSRWGGVTVAGVVAVAALGFHAVVFDDPGGQAYAHFYYDLAPQARAHYDADPPKLLSNDDGIVAFALGYPTMNAIGVMLDAEAARLARRNYLNLFELAYARGYRHFTSFGYTRGYREHIPLQASMTEAELRNWQGLGPHELAAYELRLDWMSRDGLFAVSRFVPRRRP